MAWLHGSPFGAHGDAAILDALEKAHLRRPALGTMFELDQEVAENGENLSVGEKQLVVSRALPCAQRCAALPSQVSGVSVDWS